MQLTLDKLQYKGETVTQELIIVSAWDSTRCHRILYSKEGQLLTDKTSAAELSEFLGLRFSPGTLNGDPCFIHSEKRLANG